MFTRMKIGGSIVVAILAVAALEGGLPLMSTAQDAAEVPEEIRAVIDARHKAFREKDIDALMEFYSDDAIVLGIGEGELWVGKDEIRAAHMEMFKSFDREVAKVKWSKWSVSNSKDVAWGSYLFDITSTNDDDSYTFQLNFSTVLVKEEAGWRVASIHYSNEVGESLAEDE